MAWLPCPSCGGLWPAARLRIARKGIYRDDDVFETRCGTFCGWDCERMLFVLPFTAEGDRHRALRMLVRAVYERVDWQLNYEGMPALEEVTDNLS